MLISALRSDTGAAAEVVRLVLNGTLKLLMNNKLGYEYRAVAFRPENIAAFCKTQAEVETVIKELESKQRGSWFLSGIVLYCRTPNDDFVLDVAINGHAEALLTNNLRDFEIAHRFGGRTLTPREFLEQRRRTP